MPKYKATRDYRAEKVDRDLTVFAFAAGDTVDLDEDDAAWVNGDCPGTLEPAKPPAKAAKKAPPAKADADEPAKG